MTVAAILLAARPSSALADADGLPRIRREADAAWSGGATPIVVVADDPDGSIAAALTGTPTLLVEPAPSTAGPAGQIARGVGVARDQVRETGAALVWPARMAWVGPETVTSLVEAHGGRPGRLLRPTYRGEAGWPVLLPVEALDALRDVAADRMPDDIVADLVQAGLPLEEIELGDPGSVIDGETPRDALPPYEGPPGPPSDHVHEWGAAIADLPEESLGGAPTRVPYEKPEA